jgi:hypothetical protein
MPQGKELQTRERERERCWTCFVPCGTLYPKKKKKKKKLHPRRREEELLCVLN